MSGNLFSEKDQKRFCDIARRLLRNQEAIIFDGTTEMTCSRTKDSNDHPLRHCVMNALDEVAALQGGGAYCSNFCDFNLQPRNKQSLPYLCTNYDVFTSVEPCIMCSMALLHSRIKRVFFIANCSRNLVENLDFQGCPNDGALNRLKLHVSPLVNHTFEVWQIKIAAK